MVDKSFRVLFWQPNKVRDADLSFSECIDQISKQVDVLDYTECTGGLNLRVERVAFLQNFCEGDFVRQQVDNIPPIAHAAQPLQANPNPIGHRAAFRYSVEANILGIQSGRPGVSVSAVNSYIRRRIGDHSGFFMDPCLSGDALERIRDGSPRNFELRVAQPADLAQVDPNLSQLEESLAGLQGFVDGQTVNISVGFERGNRDGLLNLRRVLDMVGWAQQNPNHVKKLKVKIDEEAEPIDMLAERLDRKGVIQLDPVDLDEAYVARIAFIRETFEQYAQELNELYGPQC